MVVAELVRNSQRHRLLGNIEGRRVLRIFTASTRFASSNGCYEAFILVCKQLSYKGVFLALVYFTSAMLYKALLDEASCTGLLSGKEQNLYSYRTGFYSADYALLEDVKNAPTAAGGPHPTFLITQISVFGPKGMVIIQESVSAAVQTFRCSIKDNKMAAQTRLLHSPSQLSTAIGASFSEDTFESTASALPASLPFSSPPASGRSFLRRSADLRL